MVTQLAYDLGQLVCLIRVCVDQLPQFSDLDLLDDHHDD